VESEEKASVNQIISHYVASIIELRPGQNKSSSAAQSAESQPLPGHSFSWYLAHPGAQNNGDEFQEVQGIHQINADDDMDQEADLEAEEVVEGSRKHAAAAAAAATASNRMHQLSKEIASKLQDLKKGEHKALRHTIAKFEKQKAELREMGMQTPEQPKSSVLPPQAVALENNDVRNYLRMNDDDDDARANAGIYGATGSIAGVGIVDNADTDSDDW